MTKPHVLTVQKSMRLLFYLAMLASYEYGWGTWIRTKSDGVRVRCLTIWRYPSAWTIYIAKGEIRVKTF